MSCVPIAASAACCYTYVAVQMAHWPFVPAILCAYILSHQAGSFVNLLATSATFSERGKCNIRSTAFLPVVGFFGQSPFFVPSSTHESFRAIFDSQIGMVAEILFFIVLGGCTFGWTSIKGWPVAVIGSLITIISQPWRDALAVRTPSAEVT